MAKYRLTATCTSQVEWNIDSTKIDKEDLEALLDKEHPLHDEVMQFIIGERPDDSQDDEFDFPSLDELTPSGKFKANVW